MKWQRNGTYCWTARRDTELRSRYYITMLFSDARINGEAYRLGTSVGNIVGYFDTLAAAQLAAELMESEK